MILLQHRQSQPPLILPLNLIRILISYLRKQLLNPLTIFGTYHLEDSPYTFRISFSVLVLSLL